MAEPLPLVLDFVDSYLLAVELLLLLLSLTAERLRSVLPDDDCARLNLEECFSIALVLDFAAELRESPYLLAVVAVRADLAAVLLLYSVIAFFFTLTSFSYSG